MDTDRPSRTAALAARLTSAGEQAEALPGGSTVRQAAELERSLGGGLIAGGVAFRLFLWLVPAGLLVASVLSFWSELNPDGLEHASREFGVSAAAAHSAAAALQNGDRNIVILFGTGIVLLAWFTLGALRALVLAYSLAWQLEPRRIRQPLYAIAMFNLIFLLHALASGGVAWLYEQVGGMALFSVITTLAVDTAIILWAMWLLPRRAKHPRELLPGAFLVAVGVQLIQVAVIVYFAPRLGRSEEAYGAFGVAATMLVWLYVISRLITGAAFLNATLWSRAQAEQGVAAEA